MTSKIFTGEDQVLYLLKESRFPLLDIIDWHITFEHKLRTHIQGEVPLKSIFITVEVWQALKKEVEHAKLVFNTEAVAFEWTKQGISFQGIELVPFFSNHEKQDKLPHCSCLIMGNTSMAKLRGL